MKKLFALFGCLLMLLSFAACEQSDQAASQNNLQRVEYWSGDQLWWYHIYNYDEEGVLRTAVSYEPTYANYNFNGFAVNGSVIMQYDENGNVVVGYDYEEYAGSEDSGHIREVVYEYDEDNKLTREVHDDSPIMPWTIEYEYDENGQLLRSVRVDVGRYASSTDVYEYDEHENPARHINQYTTSATPIAFDFVNTYDDNDNLVKYECYFGDKLEWYTDYEYDTAGNLLKEIGYDLYFYEDEPYSTTNYTYDNKGNLIQKEIIYHARNDIYLYCYDIDITNNDTSEFYIDLLDKYVKALEKADGEAITQLVNRELSIDLTLELAKNYLGSNITEAELLEFYQNIYQQELDELQQELQEKYGKYKIGYEVRECRFMEQELIDEAVADAQSFGLDNINLQSMAILQVQFYVTDGKRKDMLRNGFCYPSLMLVQAGGTWGLGGSEEFPRADMTDLRAFYGIE